jgi:hypothetical protein
MSDCPICDAYIRLLETFGNDLKANNSLKTEFKMHKEKYHGDKENEHS